MDELLFFVFPCFGSVRCYFGIQSERLFHKVTVSEMTYNVSSGTLNSTIPYYSDEITRRTARRTDTA